MYGIVRILAILTKKKKKKKEKASEAVREQTYVLQEKDKKIQRGLL